MKLFTGRNLNGAAIGVTQKGGLCDDEIKYSIVEDYTNLFHKLTDLSAHELGHQFNMDHCSCNANTMVSHCTKIFNEFVVFTLSELLCFASLVHFYRHVGGDYRIHLLPG